MRNPAVVDALESQNMHKLDKTNSEKVERYGKITNQDRQINTWNRHKHNVGARLCGARNNLSYLKESCVCKQESVINNQETLNRDRSLTGGLMMKLCAEDHGSGRLQHHILNCTRNYIS